MAFVSRIGNILKQARSKHIYIESSASNLSLYQAIRFMSSAKLFVGGLSYGTDEISLREAFAQYGEVVESRVIIDRNTGRSRGFGFVSFTSSEEASSAIQAMDGQDLQGRRVRVNYATDKPRGSGFGGGYGGSGFGGGSFGGGGYGGNYGGSGGYGGGGNNYPGGDGNYSQGGEFGGGSGNNSFDGGINREYGDGAPSGGGDFTGTGYGGTKGAAAYGGDGQLDSNSGGTDGDNDSFSQDPLEGSYRDDKDEPDDYMQTPGAEAKQLP